MLHDEVGLAKEAHWVHLIDSCNFSLLSVGLSFGSGVTSLKTGSDYIVQVVHCLEREMKRDPSMTLGLGQAATGPSRCDQSIVIHVLLSTGLRGSPRPFKLKLDPRCSLGPRLSFRPSPPDSLKTYSSPIGAAMDLFGTVPEAQPVSSESQINRSSP